MGAPGAQYWPAPSPTFNYQFAYPQVPPYMMFAPPNTPLSAMPSLYSPQTSPVASPMVRCVLHDIDHMIYFKGSNESGNNCSPPNMETPSPASSGTPTPLADLWIQQNQGGVEMPNQEMNTNVTYAPPTPFMVRLRLAKNVLTLPFSSTRIVRPCHRSGSNTSLASRRCSRLLTSSSSNSPCRTGSCRLSICRHSNRSNPSSPTTMASRRASRTHFEALIQLDIIL